MTIKENRAFYERSYHFEEDLVVIDQKRIKHFFKMVKFKKNDMMLDIGCGVGWALKYCSNKIKQGIGIDIAQKAIWLSKKMNLENINSFIADGERLPFSKNSFDIISSLGAIEHFAAPDRGLLEVNRVMKKDGQLILVVPNSFWILNKLKLYKGTEQPQEMLATLGQWGRLLRKTGFKVVKIDKDIGPKVFKNKSLIGVIKRSMLKLTLLLPTAFAYQFVFLCKKQKSV